MDFLEMMPWIWGALAVLFGIVEAMTVSMVSCWFAIGAGVAALAALLHAALWLQILLFALVSVLSFVLIHRRLIRAFHFQPEPDGAQVYLGKTGRVTETIRPSQDGRVLVEGRDWKASCSSAVEAGSLVRTLRLHGLRLKSSRCRHRRARKNESRLSKDAKGYRKTEIKLIPKGQ